MLLLQFTGRQAESCDGSKNVIIILSKSSKLKSGTTIMRDAEETKNWKGIAKVIAFKTQGKFFYKISPQSRGVNELIGELFRQTSNSSGQNFVHKFCPTETNLIMRK